MDYVRQPTSTLLFAGLPTGPIRPASPARTWRAAARDEPQHWPPLSSGYANRPPPVPCGRRTAQPQTSSAPTPPPACLGGSAPSPCTTIADLLETSIWTRIRRELAADRMLFTNWVSEPQKSRPRTSTQRRPSSHSANGYLGLVPGSGGEANTDVIPARIARQGGRGFAAGAPPHPQIPAERQPLGRLLDPDDRKSLGSLLPGPGHLSRKRTGRGSSVAQRVSPL